MSLASLVFLLAPLVLPLISIVTFIVEIGLIALLILGLIPLGAIRNIVERVNISVSATIGDYYMRRLGCF